MYFLALEKVSKIPNLNISQNYHCYEGINPLIIVLDANQIDEISTYRSVANYVVGKNPNLEILNHTANMYDSFCCAVRKDKNNLRESFDSAISSMQNENSPAGFNTAVLAEISKRINKNFELVDIDSNARAVALTSKKLTLYFG